MTHAGSYTIGIDVGTTFTAAATSQDGRTEVATLGDRSDVIPSVAFLREDDVILVGHAAERRAVADATRVARAFKRRVGDPVPLWVGGRTVTPEALTAAIVRWVVDLVATREGGAPTRTVLTCPASWGDHRRALLLGAAAQAGVGDAELLAEPVAAAMHYSAKHRLPDGATIGVYDLGGGTFDATIVRRAGDGFETVGQPQGDDHIGGIDFDAIVWDHMAGVLGVDALDLGDDPSPHELRALAQLRAAVVDAKEALSYDTQAVVPVTLPDLMSEVRINRAEFEELARPALLRTVDVFGRTCAAADVAPGELDVVLLVGGSSRIPMISQLVSSELGVPVATDAHPKLATCLGAAQAPELAGAAGAAGLAGSGRPVVVARPAVDPVPAEPAAASAAPPVLPPTAEEVAAAPPVGLAATPRRRRVAPAVTAAATPLESQEPVTAQVGGGGPAPSRGRRALAIAAAILLVAAVAGAAAMMLQGEDDAAGGDRTTTTPSSATTTTAGTTSTASTTTTVGTTTTVETTTTALAEVAVAPTPGPGAPCDPADGDPDCVDYGGNGEFTIVEGWADCLVNFPDSPGLCSDLDGDGYAMYPDSG